MKKILYAVFLCLVLSPLSFAQIFKVDSGINTSNGFEKELPFKVGVTANGNVYVSYSRGTSTIPRISYSTDNGGTWVRSDTLFPVGGSNLFSLWPYGDSLWVMAGFFDRFGPPVFRSVKGALTLGTLDTLPTPPFNYKTQYATIPPVLFSNDVMQIMYVDSSLAVANKMAHSVYSDAAYTNTQSWSRSDTNVASIWNGSNVVIGFRVMNGTLVFDLSGRDIYYFDTIPGGGRRDLGTNITGVPAGSTWRHYTAIPTRDSFFVVGIQVGDDLIVSKWNTTGGVSPTGLNRSDSTVLEPDMPPTAHDSARADICFSYKGTDTVFAIYKYWPDTADLDNSSIVFKQSTDGGATWGARQTIASGLPKTWDLMTSPKTVGTIFVFWTRDLAANTDTLYGAKYVLGGCPNMVHTLSTLSKTNTTAQLQDNVSGVTAPLDTLRLQVDNNSDFSSITFQSAINNATAPDTIQATSLTQNTKYYIRWIAWDGGCADTSQIDSVTTFATISHSITKINVTATSFRVRNDYVANNANKHVLIYDVNSSIAGSVRVDSVTSGITDPDTLGPVIGLSNNTKYYFWWVITDDWKTDTSAIDSVTTNAADLVAPDPYDFIRAWVWNVTPDTLLIKLNQIDSTDAESTMVRYDTTAIPTSISAGTQAYRGALRENNSSKYPISVFEPDWVYVSAFAADGNGNWSTYLADSLYMPSGGTGGVDDELLNRKLDSILNLQFRVSGDNGNLYDNIAAAIFAYTSGQDALLKISNIRQFIDSLMATRMAQYASGDTSFGAYNNPYGLYSINISIDTLLTRVVVMNNNSITAAVVDDGAFDSAAHSLSYWRYLADVSDSGAARSDTLAIRTMMRNNRFARLSTDTTIQMSGWNVVGRTIELGPDVITAASIANGAYDSSAFASGTFDSSHFKLKYWIKIADASDSGNAGSGGSADTTSIKAMLLNNLFARTDQSQPIDIDGTGKVQVNVVSLDANTITAAVMAPGSVDSATFTGDFWRHLAARADSGSKAVDTGVIKTMMDNNLFAKTNFKIPIQIDSNGYPQVDVVSNMDKTNYTISSAGLTSILTTLQADGTLIANLAYHWGAIDSSYQVYYPNTGVSPKDSVCIFNKLGVKKMTIKYFHSNVNTVLDSVRTFLR